jgi:predicted ATPase/DNA-binding CsgD family transcriptional regulator
MAGATDNAFAPEEIDSPLGVAPIVIDLPQQRTSFVGRSHEAAQIRALLADPALRLLTLTGPGGVGKTRLAIHVASSLERAFPGGVRFLPLATVVDPTRVMPTIGTELGIEEREDSPLIERIAEALGSARVLLILDNLEQIAGAAPAIADLLHANRAITVLVTSRVPLRITGEQEFPVPPLLLPIAGRITGSASEADAAALFIRRAREVNPRFALNERNRPAIDTICRQLDGLPLALELAAARTKVLPPEAIVQWLTSSLRLLTGGPIDQPQRQRTMRDAIAWSYGLLDVRQQAAFRRLSIFRGGFDLNAAAIVLDDGASGDGGSFAAVEHVAALVEQSLVEADTVEGDEPRYRMLQTIREFGLEQLAADPLEPETWQRLSAYWIGLAENAWSHLDSLEELGQVTGRLQLDHDNMRAVLDWLEQNDRARAFRLTGALFWFYYVRGYHAEALARFEQVLAGSRDGAAVEDLRRVLLGAGAFAHFQGKDQLAVRRLNEALVLLKGSGNDWGLGFCHLVLGISAEDAESYPRATTHFRGAIVYLERAGDVGTAASAKYHLAMVAFGEDRLVEARTLLADVLDGGGDPPRITAWALQLRALIAMIDGDLDRAIDATRESLRQFGAAQYVAGITGGFSTFAVIASSAGAAEIAAQYFSLADRINVARGDVVTGAERRRYDVAEARARAALGEAGFKAAWDAARAWTVEEAIERALAVDLRKASESVIQKAERPAGLSAREIDVLKLLTTGITNDEIAERLFLSPRTVHAHLANIYRKLDVSNRSEAVRVALELGAVS